VKGADGNDHGAENARIYAASKGVIAMTMTGKEHLYADLKRKILTMALEPGLHLDETSVSTEYGVSRTPLREVLRRLEGEGYIEIRDNRGATIAPMNHKSMRNFFLTAPLIYAAVARLAAQNATAGQIEELRDAQARFKTALKERDVNELVYWNDRFHLIIGQMADNQFLMPSLKRLLIDHARIGQTFWQSHSNDQQIDVASDHHDKFIELIEARDQEAVVALTLEHWGLSRDHLEDYIRPDPLPFDASDLSA